MIKQLNKNYICIILCSILELLAIIGAYAAHYFTKTRMGMLRHMVYLNGKWGNTFPIQTIKWISICLIIALVIFMFLRRDKNINMISKTTGLLSIIISAWTVYFILVYNTQINRAYYILSICFILMTLFQNVMYHCYLSIKINS